MNIWNVYVSINFGFKLMAIQRAMAIIGVIMFARVLAC